MTSNLCFMSHSPFMQMIHERHHLHTPPGQRIFHHLHPSFEQSTAVQDARSLEFAEALSENLLRDAV